MKFSAVALTKIKDELTPKNDNLFCKTVRDSEVIIDHTFYRISPILCILLYIIE